MKAEIEQFQIETRGLIARAQSWPKRFSEEQLLLRPTPVKWSVADCLAHLTLTAEAYRPLLEQALEAGHPRGDAPYRPSLLWRWFVWSLEPPVRFAVPTAKLFLPPPPDSAAAALEEFVTAHERLLELAAKLAPLDLRAVRVQSPFAKWMQYPLPLTWLILPAHLRRHLWQAEQLLPGLRESAT